MDYTSRILKLLLPVIFVALALAPLMANSQSNARKPEAGPPAPIFEELADQAGLKFRHYNGATGKLLLPEVMGAGAALFDFDSDGDLDIFLVQGSVLAAGDNPQRTLFPWREKDAPSGRLFRNDLVINKDGSRTLKFMDVTERSGIRADGYGMGAIVGDVNNDGRPDLYLCNLGPNRL